MFHNKHQKIKFYGARRLGGAVILLAVFALALAACQSATPAATQPPSSVTLEPMIQPAVTVADQPIADGAVTIASVVSDGPGWMVIHAQADGKPGPVLGYAPVSDGENQEVVVDIDASQATETLYAMLHTDVGQIGTYEFPGDDGPVKIGDQVITPPFKVVGAMAEMTPAVIVEDQAFVEDTVTIAKVISDGPGWLVIHTQAEGKPGPVLGYAPVTDGENQNVVVEIDESDATETLYAMLHTDAGQIGTYEFPGEDVPVTVDDQVVTPAFEIIGSVESQSGSRDVYSIVSEESQVSYEVGETFLDQGNRFNVAIGRTGQIEGEITINRENPQASSLSPILIDISQFASDSDRRDNALRERFLQSTQYPIATFEPTAIEGLPETYFEGEEVSFTITGNLTVREVTKPATFDVTIKVDGDTLIGQATGNILMSDFEVGPISIAGILNTEDEVKLTFNFIARSLSASGSS